MTDDTPTTTRQGEGAMAEQDLQERVEQLEKGLAVAETTQAGAQATQAAVQAGQASTTAASIAGMWAAIGAGAGGLVAGVFLGIAIVKGRVGERRAR